MTLPPHKKKSDNNENPRLTPKERSFQKKESIKHRSRILLIETENQLMETDPRKPLKTDPTKSPNKTESKRFKTIEITESNQIKKILEPKQHQNKINFNHTKIKKLDS